MYKWLAKKYKWKNQIGTVIIKTKVILWYQNVSTYIEGYVSKV